MHQAWAVLARYRLGKGWKRESLSQSESDNSSERTYADRWGNARTMNTRWVRHLGGDAGAYVPRQLRQWLRTARDAVPYLTTVDELNQAEAALAAVITRLRQLNEDTAEAERLRIFTYKCIGELLPPPERGGDRNPNGVNQHNKEVKLLPGNLTSRDQSISSRNYKCHTIKDHWESVEPLVEEMKKPSVNAVMREITSAISL
jgi:hypothetical protein